jgi:hypothetical protein
VAHEDFLNGEIHESVRSQVPVLGWRRYKMLCGVFSCLHLFSLLKGSSESCRINFCASNAIKKILTLTCRREVALVVVAVRFMRTVIGRKVRNLPCSMEVALQYSRLFS